MALVT